MTWFSNFAMCDDLLLFCFLSHLIGYSLGTRHVRYMTRQANATFYLEDIPVVLQLKLEPDTIDWGCIVAVWYLLSLQEHAIAGQGMEAICCKENLTERRKDTEKS